MTTTVRAQLLQQLRPVDAVFSCFPCGSITGAPKVLSIGQHQRIRATLA
jgi:anthranilate/para-aminobenzoate synthase component I